MSGQEARFRKFSESQTTLNTLQGDPMSISAVTSPSAPKSLTVAQWAKLSRRREREWRERRKGTLGAKGNENKSRAEEKGDGGKSLVLDFRA